jgi:hypothetical protein
MTFTTGDTMELQSRNRSLESHVIRKAVTRGSEGGGWKSAQLGNSLAAYPTHVRFEVAGDGNRDMEWVIEALLEETGANRLPNPSSRRHPLTLPGDAASRPCIAARLGFVGHLDLRGTTRKSQHA